MTSPKPNFIDHELLLAKVKAYGLHSNLTTFYSLTLTIETNERKKTLLIVILMSYADDNTTYTFSPDLDATFKRLKIAQLRYMNGFIKAILNLTLINAILSQPQ